MVVFHEFGEQSRPTMVLLHGWGCPWEIWNPYINMLQKDYRVIVPSLEGYNDDGAISEGVSYNSRVISDYLTDTCNEVACMVGISFGANVLFGILALGNPAVRYAIADAGYIPGAGNTEEAAMIGSMSNIYRPESRDALIDSCAAGWGIENATMMVDKILSMPLTTLERDIHSFYTYDLPEKAGNGDTVLELWYGEEESDKIANAEFVKKVFPGATTKVFQGYDHGGFLMSDSTGYLAEITRVLS